MYNTKGAVWSETHFLAIKDKISKAQVYKVLSIDRQSEI